MAQRPSPAPHYGEGTREGAMNQSKHMPHLHVRAQARPLRARRGGPLATDGGFDWSASGWAGLAAGGAFIVIQTSFVSMFTGDANTDAIRQIAAIALGEAVLPGKTPFTGLVFLSAMGVHMILSLIYARILAAIVHGMRTGRAIAIGAVFGSLLYAVNFYWFTDYFPWFAVSRGWITLFSHIAYGTIAAGVYEWLTVSNRRRGEAP